MEIKFSVKNAFIYVGWFSVKHAKHKLYNMFYALCVFPFSFASYNRLDSFSLALLKCIVQLSFRHIHYCAICYSFGFVKESLYLVWFMQVFKYSYVNKWHLRHLMCTNTHRYKMLHNKKYTLTSQCNEQTSNPNN